MYNNYSPKEYSEIHVSNSMCFLTFIFLFNITYIIFEFLDILLPKEVSLNLNFPIRCALSTNNTP